MRMRLGALTGIVALVALAAGCTWQWPEQEPEAGRGAASAQRKGSLSPEEKALLRAYKRFLEKHPDSEARAYANERSCLYSLMKTPSDVSEAYVHLGSLQVRQGEYQEALKTFEQARELHRGNAQAQQGIEEARRLIDLGETFSPLLAADRVLADADRFRAPGEGSCWAVLSYVPAFEPGVRDLCSDVRLDVFHQNAEGLEKLWRSERLLVPRFEDMDEFFELGLWALDLPNADAQALAAQVTICGASWAPSHLKVLQWRGEGLAETFQVDSDFPAEVKDVNGDGIKEIINCYKIGGYTFGLKGRWEDIYAYKDGNYVLANQDFPQEFEGWTEELRRALREHPGNAHILKHLGMMHEIEGRPSEALTAYRQAIPLLESSIRCSKEYRQYEEARTLRRQVEDIESRIRKLSAREKEDRERSAGGLRGPGRIVKRPRPGGEGR